MTNDASTGDMLARWRQHFGYLEEDGGDGAGSHFTLTYFCDTPAAFDNCVAHYAQAPFALRLSRERGQVFVELRYADRAWHDKEPLLQRLGIPLYRHPLADDGSWSGYQTAVQARDLRQHLPLLLQHLAALP